MWTVLHEHAHKVLAGRRHGRVAERRDHHVDVGVLRPGARLPVVVGALHALHRVDEMHVAVHQRAALGQRRERRQAVERDVDLSRRAATLEILDAVMKLVGNVALVHALEEGALHIHGRHHEPAADLLAVFQRDSLCLSVPDHDPVDPGLGTQLAPGRLESTGDGLRYRSHAAAGEPPRADVAVDLAHVVMQQHVGRAGRVNAERRADDAAARLGRLDDVGFEVLVEVLGDAHGPEADRLVHPVFAHLPELAPDVQELPEIP